jgi:hypothetical protein
MEATMIDPMETLIQAKDASEATFRDLIEHLGAAGRLENLVFNEGLRAQGVNPQRAIDCVALIGHIRQGRRMKPRKSYSGENPDAGTKFLPEKQSS